jgi:Kef-type K+ transport system membrane component KefB
VSAEQLGAARPRWRSRLSVTVGVVALVGALGLWGRNLLAGGGQAALDPVSRFLLAVAVIVFLGHLLAAVLRPLHQPPVVGEILGGLLLGPSVLSVLWPQGRAWLFPLSVVSNVQVAAQLGLVMFMFLLGCELRLDQVRARRTAVGSVVAGSMTLPFVGGVLLALAARGALAGSAGHTAAYVLFLGLAMSITALPVLARMLVDLRISNTSLGVLSLTCAAVGDGVAWASLTLIVALAGLAGGGVGSAGLAVAFILVTVLVVRPVLAAVVGRVERAPAGAQLLLPALVAGAIGFTALSQVIGLHPAIGAFLFGVVAPRGSAVVDRIGQQLQGFAVTILLPLFFAGIGLDTSLGLLGAVPGGWWLFAAALVIASATKMVGAGLGARLAGIGPAESLRVGVLMNCRGVTELVVASIGLHYRLINELGFTILVLIALITTALTGPLMRALTR